jgi:hypothetical protein
MFKTDELKPLFLAQYEALASMLLPTQRTAPVCRDGGGTSAFGPEGQIFYRPRNNGNYFASDLHICKR